MSTGSTLNTPREILPVYLEHQPLIEGVWARIEARVSHYPPALRRLADEFFASVKASEHLYFSTSDVPPLLYMPIWLADGLERETLLDILEATAITYFHIRLQDDVVDEGGTRGNTPWLLLANAFLWDGLEIFFALSNDAEYRSSLRQAWLLFSAATEEERRQTREYAGTTYNEPSFFDHARKVAMAEIPLYCVLKLLNRWEKAPLVPPLIHCLGKLYGLINDIRGFNRDQATGNRTYLIDRLAREIADEDTPSVERLNQAFLTSDLPIAFIDQAMSLHLEAKTIGERLGMLHIVPFTQNRLDLLENLKHQVQLTRLTMLLSRPEALISPNQPKEIEHGHQTNR